MKEKYSIDQIYDIQWLKCIRVVIWNLNKENLETSVKKIIDLIGDRYPFSSCLFISQLIHTAVSSRVGDFNIYFQFLKLFDSKKENNYHIINVFIWYLNNILTQESNFLLEKLYEQNLVTPTNFKIKKNLFFAHQMTEEEVNSLELIDPFRQIFYENVLELMKDNWKLHKKLVHELVNPNEIAKIIRVDDLEDLQEISSRNNFDYKQIIKPSLYERYSFINQKNVTLIDYSAFFGAIRCFKYLMLNDSDLKNTGKYAIAGGNEEIIHLCEQNYSTFEDAYETAIEFHRNGIFKYIYENKIGKINNLEELGQKCIEYNNFEIFLFLRSEGMKINNSIINESAEIGNIFLTKYFLKEYEIPNDIILFSALSRNIEHIKYILEQDGIDINAKGF